MNIKRFFARITVVALPLVAAVTLTAAPASATPSIDPHVFDSQNKLLIAEAYGNIVTYAYEASKVEVPTFLYATNKDTAQVRLEHPDNFVINVDEVWAYRKVALFAPAFKLAVDYRAYESRNDPEALKRGIEVHQAFVAGAVNRRLVEATGLNIVPGSKDDLAINQLIIQLSKNFEGYKNETPSESLRHFYDNGFETAWLGSV